MFVYVYLEMIRSKSYVELVLINLYHCYRIICLFCVYDCKKFNFIHIHYS